MLKRLDFLRERFAPRSYFFRLFGLISLTIMIIIVIMAYILFGRFSQYSEDLLQANNDNILTQINYNIQSTSNYINQLLLNLYNRRETSQLLYANEFNVVPVYPNMTDLDNTLVSASSIDSVYIYNSNLKQFYVMGSKMYIRDQATFEDTEIVEWINNPTLFQPLKPIYRELDHASGAGVNKVFTYVLYDAIDKNNTIQQMIVINVKAEPILYNIQNMSKNQFGPNSFIFIKEQSGHVIEVNEQKGISTELQKTCLNKDDSSINQSGHFACVADGTEYLATYQSVPNLNWKVFVLSTNQFISSRIQELKTVTFVVAGTLIVVSLLLTLLLATLLHFPVRKLEKSLVSLFDEEKGAVVKRGNEFNKVNQTLNQMKASLTSLQVFKNNHLLTLKKDLLRKLLLHPINEEQQLEPILKQFNISLPIEGRFIVVLWKVDQLADWKQAMSADEWESMKAQISAMIGDSLSKQYVCEVIEWEDQWIAIVQCAHSNIAKDLSDIQQLIEQRFHISVSVFISPNGNGIHSIRSLYQEVGYLSQYRLHFGKGCILGKESVYEIIEDNMPFPSTVVKQLKDKLMMGDQAGVEQVLDEIIVYFSAYSVQNVKFGVMNLLQQIYGWITNIESGSKVTFEFDLVKTNEQLIESETLEEVALLFKRIFAAIISKMGEKKDDKSTLWVQQIKAYMDAHLTDFNLTPNQVATHLHMSTDYIRKLFKKEMNLSMSAYINQERLQILADRLIHNEETIDMLLEQMGWENKNYFYKLFKDQYGVTPNEFRSTHQSHT